MKTIPREELEDETGEHNIYEDGFGPLDFDENTDERTIALFKDLSQGLGNAIKKMNESIKQQRYLSPE